MKILIVDDDNVRSLSLKNYLLSLNLIEEVDIVFEAASARSRMREKYYDILVLDVILPRSAADSQLSASNGIGLLRALERSPSIKKPEKIIGITADLSELSNYREEFESSCAAVIPASALAPSWREKIGSSITYTSESKRRRDQKARVVCFTVHGIRTYGNWQGRLSDALRERSDEVEIRAYKYGYFSVFRFLVPALRTREALKLVARLRPILNEVGKKEVIVFAHSFGTALVLHALSEIKAELHGAKISLVLCGSVLPEDFDWSPINSNASIKVINECAEHDWTLYLSKCFALGLGMAGKVGFFGFSGVNLINRHHRGGHSRYFESGFMEKFWVPTVFGIGPIASEVPRISRVAPYLDGLCGLIARVKFLFYLAPIVLIIYLLAKSHLFEI